MSDLTPRRWTRVHTIWLLIVLCLLPGITAAVFRDGWEQLPGTVRGAAIFVSAILTMAVVGLIVAGRR
jgi:uncharacterized membrane protein